MLTYLYPPLIGPASLRAAGFSDALRAFGWTPVVIAPADGFFHRAPIDAPAGVRVVRTRSVELSRLVRRVYSAARRRPDVADGFAVEPVRVGPVGGTLRRLLHNVLYVPDGQVGWIPFAVHAGAKVLAATAGERVLFSSSVPYSSHLAAMWLARRFHVPWVAEFRDDWTTVDESLRKNTRWRTALDRRVEGAILRRSDAVVVTAERTRNTMLAAFPSLRPDKIHVVLSGFDPFPPGVPPSPTEPMTILYAGTLYPRDDMEPLMCALDLVERRRAGSLRFRVAGPAGAWERYVEADPRRRRWSDFLGVLKPQDAEAEAARSSALLLHRPDPALAGFLAGKIFTYIGARRPVLAIIAPGTEMEALLRRHADVHSVHRYTVDAVVAAVEELLAEHRAGRLAIPSVNEDTVRPLYRREQARRLAGILRNAIETASTGRSS
ncbi:MAG: glycosyltransferase [Candidatus Rokubacteria bacterium]|nr:glycosyltransferase [Candidatus Rokubacteria bacterium]